MEEYGTIRIKLDELIEKSGISKNKLSHKAEIQRTQLNNYCNNQITRLDIDPKIPLKLYTGESNHQFV